jgi:dTDP-4-amino-4,6-dideoxygalactose transaminase
MKIAEARGLDVVEDAAHRSRARGRHAHRPSAHGTSFYATKNSPPPRRCDHHRGRCAGEHPPAPRHVARQLEPLHQGPRSRTRLQCNPSDLHAALGLTQLAKIDHHSVAAALTAVCQRVMLSSSPREYPGNFTRGIST